ncbi:MAG TPA: hypothetical protein VKJ07_03170, partial [Mycobacteriales bacterium]|nr:hypothetical protein [Mycobacteriales bacterium]
MRSDRQPLLRSRGGNAEHKDGILRRVHVTREDYLAVLLDDAVGERTTDRCALAKPTRRPHCGTNPPPGLVGREGNRASPVGDVAHQRLGVGMSECQGHRALFLQNQAIG